MKLKDAVYNRCPHCGDRQDMVSDEIYGCDQCQTVIPLYQDRDIVLSMTVFSSNYNSDYGGHAKDYSFCSWECVFEFLKTIKFDDFITLPYVFPAGSKNGLTDLLDQIKQ